jgi:S-DNA-T family DNA segregation ATPase FtsK/SpoIIIE
MAQATKKPAPRKAAPKKGVPAKAAAKQAPAGNPARRMIGGLVCLFLSLFSFIGYFDIDAWFITYFCGFIKGIVGWGYYVFPPALLVSAATLLFFRRRPVTFRVISALMTPLFLGAIFHLFSAGADTVFDKTVLSVLYKSGSAMASGGVLSGLFAIGLKSAVSIYGAAPVFVLGFIFFVMSGVGLTIPKLIAYYKNRPAPRPLPERVTLAQPVPQPASRSESVQAPAVGGKRAKAIDIPLDEAEVKNDEDYVEEKVGFFNTKPRVRTPDQVLSQGMDKRPAAKKEARSPRSAPTADVKPLTVEEAEAVAGVAHLSSESTSASAAAKKLSREEVVAETEEITKTIEKTLEESAEVYRFPSVSLLKASNGRGNVDGREEIALNRERLESTIRSFGVSGTITGITRGPTVTRYDLELEQGVKLAKLTNLAGDLALSLGVTSVRIAPIPDKISTVGIEVPNKLISTVYLREIIDSPVFKSAQSKLSFAIGEDIGGNAIVGNIAKLPHLLIAGTTGSGKSVCMNSLILSLLYKSTPDEVRLIMIDPKMVELGVYNGIPHLFVPVVTDPKKAAGALQWAVVEMLKRYRLFSECGVRDLMGYNTYQKGQNGQTMPRVVIVIDELADLMLVASKEVEESICRVAQMGRAAGMHLVIATQRPSADVITGLMKANIPSRIAFAVSSAMESRIILDNSGAEKLIGAGDMLYSPLGVGKPMRVQGAFVSDEEREKVINFVKEGAQVVYREDILEQIEKAAEGKNGGGADTDDRQDGQDGASDYDELLPQAVDVIFETKQASVSMLQRRLKLGYARAARIVDQMEEIGVVGPFEGSKPRQVLVTRQQWQETLAAQGGSPVRTAEQLSFSEYVDAPADDWKD